MNRDTENRVEHLPTGDKRRNVMKIALITALVLILVFIGGLIIGIRLTEKSDAVTNSMLQEKIDQDMAGLNRRLEGMDSKLDILLNVATNGVNRDVRP